MVDGNVISNKMANKIAKSGFNYTCVKMAFGRIGYEGLLSVLGEKANSVVQVTKQERIIQEIFQHFSSVWGARFEGIRFNVWVWGIRFEVQ